MKLHLQLIATAFLILSGPALAQTDEHHPDTAETPAASSTVTPGAMAGDVPAQCAAMMPMMQQMMQQMTSMMSVMQGGMMGGTAGEDMPAMGMSEASRAFMDAMKLMEAPMMAGAQNANPDMAFVQAMIAHHEGAIAMAEVVLQHGSDRDVKAWATEIIAAQGAEVTQMRDWLSRQAE